MATSAIVPRQLLCSSCARAAHRNTPTFLKAPHTRPLSSLQPPHQKRHKPTTTTTSTPQRPFSTTPVHPAVSTSRGHAPSKKTLRTKDRGPPSKESTQTDFSALNVLGNTIAPSTSVDVCTYDGFMLDSGLRIGDGDGVVLTASEAFVWRPWMAGPGGGGGGFGEGKAGVVNGSALRKGKTERERTGGVLNQLGQWEVGEEAWGVFKTLWPRPDLLIIGTGPSIRPLSPSTRVRLQELGMRIEVLDTRNAASQFNLLATERGVQEVAAALVPLGFGGK